jgi:NADP-dependent 3-hydroxy acid dehydrogenase YdfG
MPCDALNRFRLDGRTALVVGAGPGIGAHVAHALASVGANVIVTARSAERVGRLADEVTNSSGEAIAITAEMGMAADRDRLEALSKESLGPSHVVFHNATSPLLPGDASALNVDLELW